MRRLIVILTTGFLLHSYGCAAPRDAARPTAAQPPRPSAPAPQGDVVITRDVAGTPVDTRPAAIVNGRSVFWGELRPLLNEAAGAAMLQELILDRMIDEVAVAAGIVVDANALAGERRLLLETLHEDPNVAIRLLDELRAQQGLGRARFTALLKRNASLRALVRQAGITVTEQDIERLHDARYGAKRQARLLMTPSLADARRALARLEQGEAFVDLAVELSTDSSAARGGLLEPISRRDPSYPDSFLRTLWSLKPGEPSAPLLLDEQYAILLLIKEIEPQQVELESVRADMERQARLNHERLRMDQLARNLMADISVNIFDETLRESWNQTRLQDRSRGRP